MILFRKFSRSTQPFSERISLDLHLDEPEASGLLLLGASSAATLAAGDAVVSVGGTLVSSWENALPIKIKYIRNPQKKR